MFYSHEILTSQRHGVATVWLVATLGQNSTSKKINRKAILSVDVPRACDTIIHPEAPMALRLQGNLLYGISKVYSRQCMYTLTDIQSMLDKMKIALKVVRGGGLQSDAGKARPEELVVPYDPAFIPDFSFPILDFDLLDSPGSTGLDPKLNSSLVSSNLGISPQSQLDFNTLPQLDIDSSSATFAEFGGFSFASGSNHSPKDRDRVFGDQELGVDEEGVLLQPDFDFDEEGNIVDIGMTDAPQVMQIETPVRNGLGGVFEGRVQGAQEIDTMVMPVREDDDLRLGDDLDELEARERPSPARGRLPDPDYVDESPRNQNFASNRKFRAHKTLKMDVPTQISRDELLRLDREYVQNMARLDIQKAYARNLAQARKNAMSWISDRGIGSVGITVEHNGLPQHPLKSFAGEALLIALSNEHHLSTLGRKRRKRSLEQDSNREQNSRNVRPRAADEEPEVGLTRPHKLGGQQEDIELGRDAAPPLPDDASSHMPWNITASLQGSVAGSSSVSRTYYGGLNRRGSRFPSASPLAGRGLPLDLFGHDSLSSLSLKDFGEFHDDYAGDFIDEGNFAEHAQRSQFESQATVSSLDDTDRNFLDFIKTGTQNARLGKNGNIAFSTLLPPESTSRVVATQALLHVLTLATKDAIQVSQNKRCAGPPYAIDDLDEIRLEIRDQLETGIR